MTDRKFPLLPLLLICIAFLAGGCRSVSVPPAVTGRAIYTLNVTLPADAIVKFQLVTMTVSGEVLGVVGEQLVPNVRRPPIEFHLPYRPSEIRSRDYYGVTCEIRTGDRVVFRSARPFPVLTHGAGKHVEVLLEQVR
jgi:putative lipoprotein